ncbi:hypothetical protein ABK905_11780 [Acerihabitans sp. KWT182]|uniref:Uncharacterized protein n=1 Tax=Acerihabitans sp. KWT182 TaxID=3157919 RepID=A0AAU7QEL7_9GAMM
MLDNPTRGVDAGSKEEIYRIIRELTSQGVAIVLITDELLELIGLSNRILVMRRGRVVKALAAPPPTASRESATLSPGCCRTERRVHPSFPPFLIQEPVMQTDLPEVPAKTRRTGDFLRSVDKSFWFPIGVVVALFAFFPSPPTLSPRCVTLPPSADRPGRC